MTDRERTRLRKLQDRVVASLERRGFTDDCVIQYHDAACPSGRVTIGDLKKYIYPAWETRLLDYEADRVTR